MSDRFLWISSGFLWIPHKFLWISFGILWISYGSLWIPYRFLWISYKFLWIPIDSYGFPMDPFDSILLLEASIMDIEYNATCTMQRAKVPPPAAKPYSLIAHANKVQKVTFEAPVMCHIWFPSDVFLCLIT